MTTNPLTEISRRELLAGSTIGLGIILPGCSDFPEGRRLTLDDLTVTEIDTGYRLEFVIENHNVRDDKEADFHNVTVVGYIESGELVCERDVGDISHKFDNNDGKPAALECSRYPHLITFSASESPCDDDVIIDIAVYDEDTDSWQLDMYSRECDEGLPPSPRE